MRLTEPPADTGDMMEPGTTPTPPQSPLLTPAQGYRFWSLPATGEYVPDRAYRVSADGRALHRDGRLVARIAAASERLAAEWSCGSEEAKFAHWCAALEWIRVIPACTDREELGLQLLHREAEQAVWCEEQSHGGLVFSTDLDLRAGTWQVDPVLRAGRADDIELLHDLAEHVCWYWACGDRQATSGQTEAALPRESVDDWLPRLVGGGP